MRQVIARTWPVVQRYGAIAVLVVALVLPQLTSTYTVDVLIGIVTFGMLGLGLNLVVGYAGLLDLGYAAFFAIGAYTSALLTVALHWSFWATLPVSMAVAATAGALLGYPTLRLRSDYLAIVTLGFGEIVRITVTNLGFTGGPNGIYGIPGPQIFGYTFLTENSFYYLGMAFLLVTLFFTRRLALSRLGRAWISIREDESASEAVGVPSVRVKLWAYVMGALWAGLAGAFFAARLTAIAPDSFTYSTSITILMIVVLGGMASIPGVLLGAVVVLGFPEVLRALSLWRLFVFAIGLIALMLLRPQGIWPASRRHRAPFDALERSPGSEPGQPDAAARALRTPRDAPATDAPVLEVRELSRNFGGVRAVDSVSFEVQRGEILSIIGPNGAGKTSVFNCITGVIRPSSGQVLLGGRPVTGMRPHRVVELGLARTFQGIRLFRDMPAYENVLVGMYQRQRATVLESMLRTPAQRREERRALEASRDWLRFVGLEDKSGNRAGDLPYGDQRRLEIARALASGPEILLLDEPAAGMNPSEKQDLMALVRRIRELGVTVVLIDHDMGLIMRVSDRVIVIDRGRVIATGRPEEVRQDPAVVAAYLGSDEGEGDEEAVSGE